MNDSDAVSDADSEYITLSGGNLNLPGEKSFLIFFLKEEKFNYIRAFAHNKNSLDKKISFLLIDETVAIKMVCLNGM